MVFCMLSVTRSAYMITLPFTFLAAWFAANLLDDAYRLVDGEFALSVFGALWLSGGLVWALASALFGRPRVLLPREFRRPAANPEPQEVR